MKTFKQLYGEYLVGVGKHYIDGSTPLANIAVAMNIAREVGLVETAMHADGFQSREGFMIPTAADNGGFLWRQDPTQIVIFLNDELWQKTIDVGQNYEGSDWIFHLEARV